MAITVWKLQVKVNSHVFTYVHYSLYHRLDANHPGQLSDPAFIIFPIKSWRNRNRWSGNCCLCSVLLDCVIDVTDSCVGRMLVMVPHSEMSVTTAAVFESRVRGLVGGSRGVCGKAGSDVNWFNCSSWDRLQGVLPYLFVDSVLPEQNHKQRMDSYAQPNNKHQWIIIWFTTKINKVLNLNIYLAWQAILCSLLRYYCPENATLAQS